MRFLALVLILVFPLTCTPPRRHHDAGPPPVDAGTDAGGGWCYVLYHSSGGPTYPQCFATQGQCEATRVSDMIVGRSSDCYAGP